MSLSALGRRFERLLYLSAVISLLSGLLLFVAVATTNQSERSLGLCFEKVADFLSKKSKDADALWNIHVDAKKSSLSKVHYDFGLRNLIIDTELHGCYGLVLPEIEKRAEKGPKELESWLRKEGKRLISLPIQYPGIDMPDKATIDLFGTKLSIKLQLFANLLQFVLAPLIFLWLGSLYNTRFRETLLISKSNEISDLYPHLINIYPAIYIPPLRKRSYVRQYFPDLLCTAYSLTRLLLIGAFVLPPVVSYVASIVLLESENFPGILVFLCILVTIATLGVLLCEVLPWHASRMFPGAKIRYPK
jgi:hypothetical protein